MPNPALISVLWHGRPPRCSCCWPLHFASAGGGGACGARQALLNYFAAAWETTPLLLLLPLQVAEALAERAKRVYEKYGTVMINLEGFSRVGASGWQVGATGQK